MNFGVIGAGNGGQCMAGYLSLLGHSVKLHDKDADRIRQLKERKQIRLEGKVTGVADLDLITSEIQEAIAGTEIIMVVTTADSHFDLAIELAPYLHKEQIVVLNPGHTGGALEFLHTIQQHGCFSPPIIAETQDLLFSCRSASPGVIQVSGIKQVMDIAALPSEQISYTADLFKDIFPQFRARPNVLYTSLNNFGAMIHPVPTLLNAGRIETNQTFDYYGDGITKGIAHVVEQIDQERLAIGKALGVELTSILRWQYEAYGVKAASVYEALTKNASYKGIKAPSKLETRFLTEDVPCGLVPLASLGKLLNIEMPITNAFIETANSVLQIDYWKEGRTLERLGFQKEEFKEFIKVIS
ncbi:NAD/NADP-dependent octopine/nopaline dehydrogenase family protein [Cytobacillus firmus]|uniref:NAD/NADP-dependent octopine/nopaline dehydrogenase family protein n=1 Tax=Cytobacillus firmus TaxID=1399 RepID=UPI0024947A9A|nr:NAD/NADP-dependent octopine/nopaline dehydrogenase family protein [Cytobacillus firmus]